MSIDLLTILLVDGGCPFTMDSDTCEKGRNPLSLRSARLHQLLRSREPDLQASHHQADFNRARKLTQITLDAASNGGPNPGRITYTALCSTALPTPYQFTCFVNAPHLPPIYPTVFRLPQMNAFSARYVLSGCRTWCQSTPLTW
jgi:hypothetical protein